MPIIKKPKLDIMFKTDIENIEYNKKILDYFPKHQIEAVFNQNECYIDASFLGFMDTYEYLSKLIPNDWAVIDFGCAYNPQSFFFKDHKQIISVDCINLVKFYTPNCEFIRAAISEFIDKYIDSLDIEKTFAICNYVPSDQTKLVRQYFNNVYVFYPH